MPAACGAWFCIFFRRKRTNTEQRMSRLRKSIRIPPSSDAQVRHSCRICWSRRKSASQWGSTTVMTTGSLSSHPKSKEAEKMQVDDRQEERRTRDVRGEERFFHQRRPSGWIHSNGLSLVARRGSNLPMLHGENLRRQTGCSHDVAPSSVIVAIFHHEHTYSIKRMCSFPDRPSHVVFCHVSTTTTRFLVVFSKRMIRSWYTDQWWSHCTRIDRS